MRLYQLFAKVIYDRKDMDMDMDMEIKNDSHDVFLAAKNKNGNIYEIYINKIGFEKLREEWCNEKKCEGATINSIAGYAVKKIMDGWNKDMNKNIIEKYREQNNYTGKGGVIVIFENEVQGWVNELRDPKNWQPGCRAFDESNHEWVATGGNRENGATDWQKVR